MPVDHFGEDVAARYDDPDDPAFDPAQVEAMVDVLADLAGRGRALELGIATGRVALPLARRGVPVAGIDLVSHHYLAGDDGRFALRSVPFRYVWPAELDLMARLAGMRLRARWSGWRREPFTRTSERHVSVWEKAAS